MANTKIHNLVPPMGWLQLASPRLLPMDRRQLPTIPRIVLKRMTRRANVSAPNLFLTLIRNRNFFRQWAFFASRLMPNGLLDRQDTELVILRTAWLSRSKYEWYQHVLISLDCGLLPVEIEKVAQWPQAGGFTGHRAELLNAVDEIHELGAISDATWSRLSNHYEDTKMIELCMLIGHYRMLANVINTLGISVEDSLDAAIKNI